MNFIKKNSDHSFKNKMNHRSTVMNIAMAAVVLLATIIPLFASNTDDKIESSSRTITLIHG